MNKFIEYDVHNGILQLKCAIMNALNDIESGNETLINLGEHIPFSLILECVQDLGWKQLWNKVKTPTKNIYIDTQSKETILTKVNE